MSVNSEHARTASLWGLWGLCGMTLVLVSIASIAGGVKLERQRPILEHVTISDTVHAGDNLVVHETIIVPPGCLPRQMRQLCTERDCRNHHPSTDDPGPFREDQVQVLTDSVSIAEGAIHVPVQRDTAPGRYWFQMDLSDSGCGALSGLFPADWTHLTWAKDGKPGVPVTVLPYSPIPEASKPKG